MSDKIVTVSVADMSIPNRNRISYSEEAMAEAISRFMMSKGKKAYSGKLSVYEETGEGLTATDVLEKQLNYRKHIKAMIMSGDIKFGAEGKTLAQLCEPSKSLGVMRTEIKDGRLHFYNGDDVLIGTSSFEVEEDLMGCLNLIQHTNP